MAAAVLLQTSLTKEQFKAQLLDADMWEVCDGGVADALEDGKAFLDLAGRSCPEVVILQEGYVNAHQARLGQHHQQGCTDVISRPSHSLNSHVLPCTATARAHC